MLEIKDLFFRYDRSSPPVLNGLDLTLEKGSIGVLLGKNGVGKTTLFRILLGVLKPQSGSLMLDGQDLCRLSARRRARLLSYVPQEFPAEDLPVFEAVLSGRLPYFGVAAGKDDKEAVWRALAELKIENLAARSMKTLSGGERQKALIARALAQEPEWLVFDEPTGNLDISNELLIVDEAKKIAESRSVGILTAVHDLNLALNLADRVFFMKNGKIDLACGKNEVTADAIARCFDTRAEIIEHNHKKIVIYGDLEP